MSEDAKEIAKAVVSALESSRKLSDKTHDKHHSYIETLITKETKRGETYDSIKLHVAKYSALGIFIFMAVAAWNYFNEIMKHGVPPQ